MCANAGLKAMSFRFGTIFGTSPGMRFHTAVNKFCWQAAMGHPLTVWKTAYDQKRPYLDLSDAVRAIAFIIQNKLFDGCIYNAVSNNISVADVVNTIRHHIPKLTVDLVESRIMNSLSYEVLNSRLTRQGFLFTGNLADAVKSTIELFPRRQCTP
jgi:UDP-glucose 4-epimerase